MNDRANSWGEMSTREAECPTISIVVLNYNSLTHLRDCLDSLLRLDYRPDRIELLLADNASSDSSVEWVAAHYPIVRIVQNGSNLGFAAGNTAGARAAHGEWVAFLNPDTRVEPNWLSELIQPALRDPEIVCVASKMLTWEGDAIDFADAAINFMGWGCQPGYGSRRLTDFEQDREVLFACGGAMLIRRQVFLTVGGFDPAFFAYYEDVDLGWRLWLMGYKVALAARAVVYHRHHGSWSNVSHPKRWVLAERNTLLTIIKNYDEANLARVLPAALLLALQRAYLDVQPDLIKLGQVGAAETEQIFGLRYYLDQTWQLLRKHEYRQLWRRASDEVNHRRHSAQGATSPARSGARSIDGQFDVPMMALSRLVAGCQVLQILPDLMLTRQLTQSARQRTDQQIFPLFQWALISNFGDDRFIQAMQETIARFGLADVFDAAHVPGPIGAKTMELSREASHLLLQTMDHAFTLSGVPEEHFDLHGPSLAEVNHLPLKSVAVLAEMNQLLWSLPDAVLPDVLNCVIARCRKILGEQA